MNDHVDLEAVKGVQQKVWSTGDFSEVAKTVQTTSDALVNALDVMPGERVLDVACGSGNAAIPAARPFAQVTALDYVPELLERGRERARAERLEIEFVEGDAENLPFEDGSFDVVLSVFGVMFAPDHQRAANELLRVCRPGGRIGLACWVPDGYVGEMFKTVAGHTPPPPPGVQPPSLWGTEDHLKELFGDGIGELRAERRANRMKFHSAEHQSEFMRTNFGPTQMAYAAVGEEGEEALGADLAALTERYNVGEGVLVVDAEYLQVVATRA